MMRSEKRPGYPNLLTPKKPRRSVWYQTLTIIMLIVLCPVGLVLLWRKRLTWHGVIKLLATLLSLILLFLMLGAALWYPFENEKIREVQNNVSAALTKATDACTGFFADMGENLRTVVNNAPKIGAAAGDYMLGQFLDAIASPTPKPTVVPPLTLMQGDADREGIASLMNRPTPTPTPTPSPTPTPTAVPTATPTTEVSANKPERPTPSSAAGATRTPVPPVTATPIPTATPLTTSTPINTTKPTVNPALIPPLEEIGEQLVWHTSNGKWYHKTSVCGSMSNAKQYTLSSAVAKGLTACPYCHPIDAKWGKETKPVVYVSTDKYWHTRTVCESNTDEWTPMLLDDVRKDKTLRPCDACGAHHYENGVPSVTGSVVSTNVPNTSATATPLPSGTSATIPSLEEIGEQLVWHTSNGKWYHKTSVCGSMSNAKQHTLSSAVAKGLTACPYCHPIDAKWGKETKPVVYVSTNKYWHTQAGCRSNTAEWTPMLLDNARKDSTLKPCTACGAHYYKDGVPEGAGSAIATSAPNAAATTSPQTTSQPVGDGLNLGQVTNGDTLVYYSANTSHYHRRNRCASSTTTTFMPHTLMDALLEGKIACPVCNPPEPITE